VLTMSFLLQYSPRHANSNKALANWQRKSDHLLREIVKFRTYIDSLSAAQQAKERFYAKRAEVEAAKDALSTVDPGRGRRRESDVSPQTLD